ncbi:MAG TPA: sigma-70 family RNA polymerase sigma factor [Abditibacterium sp.]|jgi:RNA polymerase sigma-70 factor (ECF subfamily)
MKFSLAARLSLTQPRDASNAQAELLRRARDGDREAIGVLFGRSRQRIFGLAFQILRDEGAAEDAAQEILLRAFEKMPQFRGESEFSTWLYRLALNHCLERRRISQRRDALAEIHLETPRDTSSPEKRIETRLALETALDELSEPLRIALILREWHELTYDEIASILNLPVGTVRSRLSEARRRFRHIWEAQNAE